MSLKMERFVVSTHNHYYMDTVQKIRNQDSLPEAISNEDQAIQQIMVRARRAFSTRSRSRARTRRSSPGSWLARQSLRL